MLSIAEITARENLYQFFASSLLKEPSKEFLQGIIETAPYLKEIFTDVSFSEWDQIFQNYQNGMITLPDLRQDFYDLFFVTVSGRYFPAVESIVLYQRMWSETEFEVAQRYEKVNFKPADLQIFVPFKQLGMADLLGYELAYLAHLCKMETNSSMELRRQIQLEELNMLEEHIIPFVQKYKDLSFFLTKGTLYGVLIDLILHFAQMDRQMILDSGVIEYAK